MSLFPAVFFPHCTSERSVHPPGGVVAWVSQECAAGLSKAWEKRVAELKERFTELSAQVRQRRVLAEGCKGQVFQTDRKYF